MNTEILIENKKIERAYQTHGYCGLSFKTCTQCGCECDTEIEIVESIVGVSCGGPRYECGPVIVSACCSALVRDENGNEVIYGE